MEQLIPRDLSRMLKPRPVTVTRLARQGKLPGFSAGGGSANLCGGKVGGSWRFRKDQFERWAGTKSTKKTGRRKRVITG